MHDLYQSTSWVILKLVIKQVDKDQISTVNEADISSVIPSI